MADSCIVSLDRHRARRYFLLLSAASIVVSWTVWFVMGFMGSNASPDGITAGDLLRTTAYSLPIGIMLALVFPVLIRVERQKKWVVDIEGIDVYERGKLVLSCTWSDLGDVIFREYSVGICVPGKVPEEYNIVLPGEKACFELSELYNRAKGTYCAMDNRPPS